MAITILGPEPGDVCHCQEGGRHDKLLSARGWTRLTDFGAKQIRAVSPQGLRLPPNAKPAKLAKLVTDAVLAGGVLSSDGWPVIEADTVEDLEDVNPLECPECGRDDFASVAGMRNHRTAMHG